MRTNVFVSPPPPPPQGSPGGPGHQTILVPVMCSQLPLSPKERNCHHGWNHIFNQLCCLKFPGPGIRIPRPSIWRQNSAHPVFALRTNFRAWRAQGLEQKLYCRTCGVEYTCRVVLHVHQGPGRCQCFQTSAQTFVNISEV